MRSIMELLTKFYVMLNTDSPDSAEQVKFIEAQYMGTCKSSYTKWYALIRVLTSFDSFAKKL